MKEVNLFLFWYFDILIFWGVAEMPKNNNYRKKVDGLRINDRLQEKLNLLKKYEQKL